MASLLRENVILPSGLYLANLLIAPGIAYVLLIILLVRFRESKNLLFLYHLKASLILATSVGVILISVPLGILLIGYFNDLSWMLALTFLVTFHGFSVIFGVYLLAKAMANQTFWFPCLKRPNLSG